DVVIERLGFVFDPCRRYTGLDQLNPPTIHDFVPGRCSDSHGPAKMMGDPHTHTLEYLAPSFSPARPHRRVLRPSSAGWGSPLKGRDRLPHRAASAATDHTPIGVRQET